MKMMNPLTEAAFLLLRQLETPTRELSGYEEKFCESLREQIEAHKPITEKQYAVLESIAERKM